MQQTLLFFSKNIFVSFLVLSKYLIGFHSRADHLCDLLLFSLHAFFISNTLVSNTRLNEIAKKIKQKLTTPWDWTFVTFFIDVIIQN